MTFKQFIILALFTLAIVANAENAPQVTETNESQIVEKPVSGFDKNTSEFFFQAAPGETVFSLSPTYEESSRGTQSGTKPWSARFNSTALQMTAEHGFSDQLTLRFQTSYGNDTDAYSTRSYPYNFQGFSDLLLSANGFMELHQVHFVYSLQVGISPAMDEYSQRDVPGNRFSGGQSLTPRVGLEVPITNNWRTGPYLQYAYKWDRAFESIDTSGNSQNTGSVSGENQLIVGAFGEYARHRFAAGGFAQVANNDAGVKTSATTGAVNNFDASQYALAGLYGTLNLNETLLVKPEATYSFLLDNTLDGVTSYGRSVLDLSVTLRMAL